MITITMALQKPYINLWKSKMSLNIVLYEPEIALNTGNIVRTCVCTGATLHMIRPFGFIMSERTIKRSGMDYIQHADIRYYDSFEEYFEKYDLEKMFFFTTKSNKFHTEVKYPEDSHIIFGPESRGLPEKVRSLNPDHNVRIPMKNQDYVRSLNLANSVCVGIYEVIRQQNLSYFI